MGKTACGAGTPVGNTVPGPLGDSGEVGQLRVMELGTRGVEDGTQGSRFHVCMGGAQEGEQDIRVRCRVARCT